MGMLLDLAEQAKPSARMVQPDRDAEAAELRCSVEAVGDLYGFSPEEHRDALAIALADPVAALDCFRAIAAENRIRLDVEHGH